MKTYFDQKLFVLKDMVSTTQETEATSTGVEKLEAIVIEEITDTSERQISEVVYLGQGVEADEALSSRVGRIRLFFIEFIGVGEFLCFRVC